MTFYKCVPLIAVLAVPAVSQGQRPDPHVAVRAVLKELVEINTARKGNLVARLRGTGLRRPILLLAHLDVVAANPADWSVDPFKLTEKDGYYYGRGTGDDKYMAAAFVANLIRYKQEGYKPDRDIILALETDEEILDRRLADDGARIGAGIDDAAPLPQHPQADR